MIPRKVEPMKCLHDKLLASTHLTLLYFKAIVYPRHISMFSENLATTENKLSCNVMHKLMIINSEIFPKEFDIDPRPLKLITRSFPAYTKDSTIDFLFPY